MEVSNDTLYEQSSNTLTSVEFTCTGRQSFPSLVKVFTMIFKITFLCGVLCELTGYSY